MTNDQSRTRVVIGIGNPGDEYERTRHNVGFEVLDLLAQRHHAAFRKWTPLARRAKASTPDGPLRLVKPLTYVNLTGKVIPALMEEYGPLGQNIMIVCDDINLPLGSIRLRARGSSGGHNGLKSLIEAMGTEEFPRLRLGVGAPEGTDAADYVLDRFRKPELPVVAAAIERAADAVQLWHRRGIPAAMNEFNLPPDKK